MQTKSRKIDVNGTVIMENLSVFPGGEMVLILS